MPSSATNQVPMSSSFISAVIHNLLRGIHSSQHTVHCQRDKTVKYEQRANHLYICTLKYKNTTPYILSRQFYNIYVYV